jgi:hypothetical protein
MRPGARPAEAAVHDRVFAIAARLLRGETIAFICRTGRHWRARATTLELLVSGRFELVVASDAADVAVEVARRLPEN